MDVNVRVENFKSAAVDALVIGVFEGEESTRSGIVQTADEALEGALRRLVDLGDFEGNTNRRLFSIQATRSQRPGSPLSAWANRMSLTPKKHAKPPVKLPVSSEILAPRRLGFPRRRTRRPK